MQRQVEVDRTTMVVKQRVFNEMSEFTYRHFEDLKSNGIYDQFEAGQLQVTSGKIVCTDPMYRILGLPQFWEVPTGNYPVNLFIGLSGDFEGRVAYAEIIFSNDSIESWEYSLIDEELLSDDFEKKMNGMYPVENGLSSFSDFEAWKEYEKSVIQYQKKDDNSNFYSDILEPLFKQNNGVPQSSRGEDWLNYKFSGGNIIIFGSGWGDGLYSRFVAFNDKGKPVKLLTDFTGLNQFKE